MKYVNVVFGDDLSDVEIISVPDDVAENIEDLGQQFCNWLSNDGSCQVLLGKIKRRDRVAGVWRKL